MYMYPYRIWLLINYAKPMGFLVSCFIDIRQIGWFVWALGFFDFSHNVFPRSPHNPMSEVVTGNLSGLSLHIIIGTLAYPQRKICCGFA